MIGSGADPARRIAAPAPGRVRRLPRRAITPSVDEGGSFQPDRPLDPQAIASLQRAAGNAAVAALVTRVRPGPIQRVPAAGTAGWTAKGTAGWSDVPSDSWNAQEMDLGTMRRIPVDGLAVGKQSEKNASNDTLTDEQAGKRAILVASSSLVPTAKVDVMVHLHGYTEKYDKNGKRIYRPYAGLRQHKVSGEVRDVALDRVEAQLAAANQPQLVAILAQGGVKSQFGEGDDAYGLDATAYAQDVLDKATTAKVWPSQPPLGRVIMSAHSGGGHTVRRAMEKELDAKKKKVTGPSAFAEVVLFDAINNSDELTTTTAWVLGRLDADLAVLIDKGKTDSAKTDYLKQSTRFRGYYASYKTTYEALGRSICGWFGTHAAELGTWGEPLWANYQVIDSGLGSGGHEEVMRGSHTSDKKAAAGSGNIADAVLALDNTDGPQVDGGVLWARTKGQGRRRPRRRKSKPPQAGGTAAPGPTASGAAGGLAAGAVANALGGLAAGAAGGALAEARGGAVADASGALNAETGGSTQTPATSSTTLGAPTTLPTTTPVQAGAVEPATTSPSDASSDQKAFISAISRTTLELLPAAERTRFEAITWVDLDYPDAKMKVKDTSEANLEKWRSDPAYVLYSVETEVKHVPTTIWFIKGSHQAEAQALLNALSRVRPGGGERRANTGANAILTKAQFKKDPAAYDDYIESQLADVPDEDVQMNKYAVPKFVAMRAAAKGDGVRLSINNAMRLRSVAEANAAKSGNAKAVASYSSHSLGLAMDLNLRTRAMGKRVADVSTAMTNVMGLLGAPAYKWMFQRGAEFGFYQYRNEPWHWEYNPKGFRESFWADMPDLRPAEEVAAPKPGRKKRS